MLCAGTFAPVLNGEDLLPTAYGEAAQRRSAPVRRPAQCGTFNALHFGSFFRGSLNGDLNDYGILVEDAGRAECAEEARDRLLEKVRATLAEPMHRDQLGQQVGPYQGWLEGGHLALAFAAAMEIHGRGFLTSELDRELTYAAASYRLAVEPGCGFSGERWRGYDTCMDDYTVAASAWAWISAYEFSRGRSAEPWASAAVYALRASLGAESVCVHIPSLSASNPCAASVADLAAGRAQVMSLNHGQQSVHYGFGLMTSVAAAVLALNYAGVPFEFTAEERIRANGLRHEAQRKSDPDGQWFKKNCARNLRREGNQWTADWDADCGESTTFGYRPRMYGLADFYTRYVGPPASTCVDFGIEQRAYQFDTFDQSLFSDSYLDFQNAGRRATYGLLAHHWWKTPPPMPERAKPLNDFEPIGFLEEITDGGVAIGWACDRDAPETPAEVWLRHDGRDRDLVVAGGTANEPSEGEVNAICGGTMHRFRIQLPAESAGRSVKGFVLDAASRAPFALDERCEASAGICEWRPAKLN